MSFQAVGPEELKERSPKLVVQDRGTSSLFASDERNRGRPGTEVSNMLLYTALQQRTTMDDLVCCVNTA